MTNRIVAMLVASSLACPAWSQAPGPGDPAFEISLLLARAREAAEQCRLDQAKTWYRQAQDRLNRVPEDDTIFALHLRSTAGLADNERLRQDLRLNSQRIEQLVKERRLETARRVVNRLATESPVCLAHLGDITAELDHRLRQADLIAREADDLVPRRPKESLRLYKKALAINRELDGYEARVARARANQPPKRHTLAKGIFWTTFLTALGVGAYVAVDSYQRKMDANAKSATAVPSPSRR